MKKILKILTNRTGTVMFLRLFILALCSVNSLDTVCAAPAAHCAGAAHPTDHIANRIREILNHFPEGTPAGAAFSAAVIKKTQTRRLPSQRDELAAYESTFKEFLTAYGISEEEIPEIDRHIANATDQLRGAELPLPEPPTSYGYSLESHCKRLAALKKSLKENKEQITRNTRALGLIEVLSNVARTAAASPSFSVDRSVSPEVRLATLKEQLKKAGSNSFSVADTHRNQLLTFLPEGIQTIPYLSSQFIFALLVHNSHDELVERAQAYRMHFLDILKTGSGIDHLSLLTAPIIETIRPLAQRYQALDDQAQKLRKECPAIYKEIDRAANASWSGDPSKAKALIAQKASEFSSRGASSERSEREKLLLKLSRFEAIESGIPGGLSGLNNRQQALTVYALDASTDLVEAKLNTLEKIVSLAETLDRQNRIRRALNSLTATESANFISTVTANLILKGLTLGSPEAYFEETKLFEAQVLTFNDTKGKNRLREKIECLELIDAFNEEIQLFPNYIKRFFNLAWLNDAPLTKVKKELGSLHTRLKEVVPLFEEDCDFTTYCHRNLTFFTGSIRPKREAKFIAKQLERFAKNYKSTDSEPSFLPTSLHADDHSGSLVSSFAGNLFESPFISSIKGTAGIVTFVAAVYGIMYKRLQPKDEAGNPLTFVQFVKDEWKKKGLLFWGTVASGVCLSAGTLGSVINYFTTPATAGHGCVVAGQPCSQVNSDAAGVVDETGYGSGSDDGDDGSDGEDAGAAYGYPPIPAPSAPPYDALYVAPHGGGGGAAGALTAIRGLRD